MTTHNQIEANRRNAQLSTGPKTDEGKAAASRNALKHGLRAQHHLLLDESPEEFDAFCQPFFDQLAPQTPMESHFARQAIALAWRIQRIPRIESEFINNHMAEVAGHRNSPNPLGAAFTCSASDAIKTLTRYESTLNRQFNTAMKQIQLLQATRMNTPNPNLGTPSTSSVSSSANLPNEPISASPISSNSINDKELMGQVVDGFLARQHKSSHSQMAMPSDTKLPPPVNNCQISHLVP